MKKSLFTTVIAASALSLAMPAHADHAKGVVQEILIKIQTKDGVQWLKLGKDLQKVDLSPGDLVEFDYADDVIETIDVVPAAAGGTRTTTE